MKILHVSNYFYPHIGGIEQVARDCLNSLIGNEQKLVCFNSEKEDVTDVIDGFEIVRAGTFAKVASQSLSLSFKKRLTDTFNEFNPDVVLFHYPNPFEARYLLKLLKKHPTCKFILWWHLDITKQKILGKLFKGQTLALLNRADKIVCTSPQYLEHSDFLPAFKDKCSVIPNCANDERISITDEIVARAEEIKKEYEGKTICFGVGRHVPYKGMTYLVEASTHLPSDYAVLIGGKGELTESLMEQAKGDDKVKFLGRIPDEDLKAYMLACDVFCFPSITKNEAFGVALAEAMSLGKPSVTFTVKGSGINFVNINGETGIEVENGNAKAFADAIVKIATDSELKARYGENAKVRATTLFSESVFKANVKNLFDQL